LNFLKTNEQPVHFWYADSQASAQRRSGADSGAARLRRLPQKGSLPADPVCVVKKFVGAAIGSPLAVIFHDALPNAPQALFFLLVQKE